MNTPTVESGESTFSHLGYRVEIQHDEDAGSPRTDFDNLSTMICFHKRYQLGDQGHGFKHGDYNDWDEVEQAIIREHNPAVILPLYLMDHSGLSIATTPFGCPWDSGQVGFVFVPKEKVYEEFGVKRITSKLRDKVEAILLGEVSTYDDFLNGFVYGYTVTHKASEEEAGSCWGYYGMDHERSGLAESALDDIKQHILCRRQRRLAQLKTWITARVPLNVRWEQSRA